MGPKGLQIASALSYPVSTSTDLVTRMGNGAVERPVGVVELPLTIGGVTKNLKVLILLNLDADCYLGSDFIIEFRAILNPQRNTITVAEASEPMAVEFASLNTGREFEVSAVGVSKASPSKLEAVEKLLNKILPEAVADYLPHTNLVECEIDVGDARPIKQRYYDVSKKMEEEMHKQTRRMLGMGVIEPSKSSWSSFVVLTKRPSSDKYRF